MLSWIVAADGLGSPKPDCTSDQLVELQRALYRFSRPAWQTMLVGVLDRLRYSRLTIIPDYRKTMMMTSIFLFGTLALPFAGLTGKTYSHLTALSVLYCFLTTIGGVYTVIEGSYIPIFMRSTGWFRESRVAATTGERTTWNKGVSISVLALVSSNIGGLTALIIGIILVYGRGSYVKVGYFNYLLAITIGGGITSELPCLC